VESKSPQNHRQTFFVKGMTCVTCVKHVEKAIQKIEGVNFVSVNLGTESGFILSDVPVSFEIVRKAVRDVGYDLEESRTEEEVRNRFKESVITLILVWGVTLPLSIFMILHMSGFHLRFYPWVEMLATGFVVFFIGSKIIRGAWIALIHAHSNMDTLIFFGSVTAWVTSFLSLIGIAVTSFGSVGAMIVAIHLTGRFIESWLRDRASKDVKALLQLQAQEARIKSGEQWILIPVEAVKLDSLVMVYPSERIPLDGEVVEGLSSVDESMITGEFLPSQKRNGSQVTGGSLNLNAPLTFRVTRVGKDLFLSQLISMIEDAQGTKVPIQAVADRVTLWFVPIVILLAIIAGLTWFFGYNAFLPFLEKIRGFLPWVTVTSDALSFSIFVFVATLVIACPCALGLAIPMALIGASSLSAKKGLIIRNAEAIQTAQKIRTIILDKTGTLTVGKPTVIETTVPEELLGSVAALELRSAHPLAKSIVEYVKGKKEEQDVVFTKVEEIPGEGVTGEMSIGSLFVGKPTNFGIYDSWIKKGYTLVEVRIESEVKGAFGLIDPIRDDTKSSITALKAMNMDIVLATGDHEETARRVSLETGIPLFKSQLKPADKLSFINSLRHSEGKVLMVGDGLNDGPALKAADIGIAMGSGTDLAIDNADIVIVRGGISGVVESLRISQKTFRIIKENLFWAFMYNTIAIPLAMLGFLHPAIAETAMAFSSITVILNSLRLRRTKT
jgi:Cu+-exporting ATPase